ncbi:MAG: hypothetical protein CL842_04485 [Crocinitomicaceae bacterium]|nr:hypothetical protein [Crocinitomicaceae bacterium]
MRILAFIVAFLLTSNLLTAQDALFNHYGKSEGLSSNEIYDIAQDNAGPQTVTVRIYTINGTLVRTLEKDDDTITFLEWDLKNQSRVPIASGMYIYHIDAPGIGETILKWMAVMRPIDLDNF